MILKLLLLIVVIVTVYFIFFKKDRVSQETNKDKKNKKTKVDDMIECHRCGVYVSVEEAILSDGNYYCSRECLKG